MITTIDFETDEIRKRPEYPPKPAGVSIWHANAEKPIYLAWGHPSGNNCTFEEAKKQLVNVWGEPLLFHNAKFDTEVAKVHMGLDHKDPLDIHDTMFLLYLQDSQAPSLSLKPSAERLLGMPPTEQNALQTWLKLKGLREFDYAKAPGDLVAPYADGDTRRTRMLYELLLPQINKSGMLEAYRREQKLRPILQLTEADGTYVDMPRLERDLTLYERVFVDVTNRIQDKIGKCNIDSAGELAAALIRSQYAQESDFLKTPTGRLSTAKASMDRAVKEPELRQLLQYRSALKTILTTFMRPWFEIASANGGKIHPEFNQVKGDIYGTRTGRLSSSNPNFQNVPTEFHVEPPAGCPPLPYMRRYVLPDPGHLLMAADFNGQEMRIAAHFAEGRAAEIYRNDPRADFHQAVANIIEEDAGLVLPRKDVKITGFSLIYGSGVNALAELLGVDKGTASRIRNHYFQALPGFQELMNEVSARGRHGLPVKTWGGRLLYAEKAKMVNGQMWTFDYKLLNYLIQGSAADQTKESINTTGYQTRAKRFMITVHDENVFSVDPDRVDEAVEEIRHSMEDQQGWDVPFKVEIEAGDNWWDLKEYNGSAKMVHGMQLLTH